MKFTKNLKRFIVLLIVQSALGIMFDLAVPMPLSTLQMAGAWLSILGSTAVGYWAAVGLIGD